MKLMKMTLFAVAGGLAANYLLKKTGSSAGGRASSGASDGGAGASSASLGSASGGSGSGARSQRLSARSPVATGAESPNAAERLLAARPDDSLASAGGGSLDPLRSSSRDGEFATSTGLSDFSRGA